MNPFLDSLGGHYVSLVTLTWRWGTLLEQKKPISSPFPWERVNQGGSPTPATLSHCLPPKKHHLLDKHGF